VDNLLKRLSNW